MATFLKSSSTLLPKPPPSPPKSSSRRKQQQKQHQEDEVTVNISSEPIDNRSTFHNSLSSYHTRNHTKQTRKNNPNSNQMQKMHRRKSNKFPILSSLFKKKKNKHPKQSNLLSPLTHSTHKTTASSNTSHQLQDRELTKASLVTLGTIELNSYDDIRNIDYYYDDDDDFYEDNNHGLSSCGSVMRLSTPEEDEEEENDYNDGLPQEERIRDKHDENKEDNHSSSFVTAHSTALSSSSSSSDFDHSSFQSLEKDDENVVNSNNNNTNINNITVTTTTPTAITNSSLSKPSCNHCRNNKQNHNDEKTYDVHLAHENKKIATLFQLGKECYNNGSYDDALQIQKEALDIVLYHISTQKNSHPNHNNHNHSQDQIHLFQRQAAMIQYEIAKSEFVIYKENYYYTQPSTSTISSLQSSPTCLQSWDDKQLSRLFDKMENAKCVVSFQELAFYKNQLHLLDQQQEQQQQSSDCTILSLQRIDILNAIAKIYFKNLHQYELALDYYNQVLELEFAVFTSLSELKQELNDENGDHDSDNNVDSTNLGDEIREWKIKIQQTKKKIGAIYYLNGRFDMALLSSFSFHSSTGT